IYGVIAYWVDQRTREIGIRMALGADARRILGLVGREFGVMILAGVAVGLGGAFALTRLMNSLLFGVSATDVTTFAVIPVVLAAIALAATFVPARRATRVEPIVAVRAEERGNGGTVERWKGGTGERWNVERGDGGTVIASAARDLLFRHACVRATKRGATPLFHGASEFLAPIRHPMHDRPQPIGKVRRSRERKIRAEFVRRLMVVIELSH